MHLVNLSLGANPGNVGFQVVYTALIGFAYAAVALVTGSIWPLVLIHSAQDFINAMQQSPAAATTTSAGVDVANGLLNVGIFLVFAAYGYWLLRRHAREASVSKGPIVRSKLPA